MRRAKDSGPVALVVALEAELQHVLAAVGRVREKQDGIWLDRYATVAGLLVVAVRSGVGLINAAAATERVINAYRPRVVLNYGCAGAHRRDILPGDVIIGTCVVYHSAVQFLATGEDMEAVAVAQVCALHSVPFLTIKDISNNEFHTVTDITGGFTNFPKAEAGRCAAALLLRLIERLAASSS